MPFDQEGCEDVVRELDGWRERLDRRVLSRQWAGRIRRDLEAEAVAASTRMEGVPVTIDDVRRILAGDPPAEVSAENESLVRGYRDAMTFVLRRADDRHFVWNRELVVGIHDRVLAGDFGRGAGRLREGAAWVARHGEVLFEPPPADRVPALVDELCETCSRSSWHPAIRAAWLHAGVAAIHPFKDGNGRTARVLASLAMYRGGFRGRDFTSLEEWWGRHADDYYAAFDCLGGAFDRETDVTPFVHAHVTAQRDQVRSLDLRERTQRRLWTLIENLLSELRLRGRLANALWEAFFGRPVTSPYYRGMSDVSKATATNDLVSAARAGLLETAGRTRGRRYLPGPQLMERLCGQLGIEAAGDAETTRALVLNELTRRALEEDAEQL